MSSKKEQNPLNSEEQKDLLNETPENENMEVKNSAGEESTANEEDNPGKAEVEVPVSSPEEASEEAGKEEGDSPEAAPGTDVHSGEEEAENASFPEEDNTVDELSDEDLDAHGKKEEEYPDWQENREPVEKEKIDYSHTGSSELIRILREMISQKAIDEIRDDVDQIREILEARLAADLQAKKERFIDDGGAELDFKPVEDPVENELKECLAKYKALKTEYYKQLEQVKQDNLVLKQNLLEEFRVLMEQQEPFDKTFRLFKDLQRRWFEIGVVPQQNMKDLWESYNYFVEKFNDYVNINRELRVLDHKKNLELKIQLCEKAEALSAEPNVVEAFRILQKYHKKWREIGPVPRENRDEIWERFKQATSVINKMHQEMQVKMRESLQDNLAKKVELCEKVEEIAAITPEGHQDWMKLTNEILQLQKKWKSIGYAPKKDNNLVYQRFRNACDRFFDAKAQYYSKAFEAQKDNLDKKIRIVERAEALQDSNDWKEATNELIDLQHQWKEIGPVPRRESDRLWKKFRAACDRFFERKSSFFENIDVAYQDNLEAKEKIIEELESFDTTGVPDEVFEKLKSIQEQYAAIGFVPSAKKEDIRIRYSRALEKVYNSLDMDENMKSMLKFKNRVLNLLQSPKGESKFTFERDKLMNKLQQLRNDISVWENNIGFFKQSESSENTIQSFQEKIEDAHIRIKNLEEKIQMMDDLESEYEE
ncbi:MAG: DUF349 domain-containing protein [Bacteroidota bacterium]